MLVVILVIGAGLLGPSEERLTRLAEGDDQGEYGSVLRRVKFGTYFLSLLVVDFESQLSEEDLATLASFVAENAGN